MFLKFFIKYINVIFDYTFFKVNNIFTITINLYFLLIKNQKYHLRHHFFLYRQFYIFIT